jgi:anti-anti-sigma factor
MEIIIKDDTGTTAKIGLVGKLDIVGAGVIAQPLATLAGAKTNILVDMSEVTFIASIGIRHLVMATRALAHQNGRLILVNPTAFVRDTLVTSGVTDLLPIAATESEASAMLR